jgi:predicted DNA-binding transcriptional regulator AlpA
VTPRSLFFLTNYLISAWRGAQPLSGLNQTEVAYVDILPDIFPIPSGGRADAARSALAFEQRSWITAPQLAIELGISRRTLARWLREVPLGFPRPHCIHHRLYFERSAIDLWKTATAVKAARRDKP